MYQITEEKRAFENEEKTVYGIYYDDEYNVDLEITKTTGKVYLYKKASSDHHMFFYLKLY